MGFARITLHVDLSRRPEAALVAEEIVSTFAGTRNTSIAGDVVTCELQFPGNLSALAARLQSNNVPIQGSVAVRIPIRRAVPAKADDAEALRMTLIEGPEIWDPEFHIGNYVVDAGVEAEAVTATVHPTTHAMHQLYDALLHKGIFSDDRATSVAAE